MHEEVKFHNNPVNNERILAEAASEIIYKKLIEFTAAHYPEMKDFLDAQIAFEQAEEEMKFATAPESDSGLEEARKILEKLTKAGERFKIEMDKIRINPELDQKHTDWLLEWQGNIKEKVFELKGPTPKFVKIGDEIKKIGEN